MTAKGAAKGAASKTPNSAGPSIKKTQTTLVPSEWGKKSLMSAATKNRPKAAPNGNIMAFFRKAEDLNNRIFMQDRGSDAVMTFGVTDEHVGWSIEHKDDAPLIDNDEERYNENGGSIKRWKASEDEPIEASTPPQPEINDGTPTNSVSNEGAALAPKGRKKAGPFIDDSESEDDDTQMTARRRGTVQQPLTTATCISKPSEYSTSTDDADPTINVPIAADYVSQYGVDDFKEFEDLEDDHMLEGEENDERRWLVGQRMLEMAEADFDCTEHVSSLLVDGAVEDITRGNQGSDHTPICPICDVMLATLTEQEAHKHVNACLDGDPLPLPKASEQKVVADIRSNAKLFKQPDYPAKAGQVNPFQLSETGSEPKSAFSKLMASHAEDAAWANAAATESASRGKPSYQRTCPFYKIIPGFSVCVDAFRYGAIKGQNAYFLSHFHSDHYIGLTASWSHGPIYCSKITGNLVRQQLRVNPRYVVDLEFDVKTEVPGTEGVHVTMIPANHCPGSSLFLFEKRIGKSENSRLQRVLHCGDFRACQAHIEHPLLRPVVVDTVTGKDRQQKLDVCYLDTTYLNPKYAFPPQHQVIQACADKCVSLNKLQDDPIQNPEKLTYETATPSIAKFIRNDCDVKDRDDETHVASNVTESGNSTESGRLLVVVGTYSIGKERICIGIAKALKTKIYAPPNKQRICHALEDPELNALLTTNPREAQVHMTPLFEIRAETLDDYLRDYRDAFSRAVGFRPSGWNYRPPNSRFTESPSVSNVLYSQSWKSQFSMKNLAPQRGSTSRASCFGVPYSEHSSFRELTMFCCALRVDKIIPTVNVGSARSRERMKGWCEKWMTEKKKNGLYRWEDYGEEH